MSIADLIQSIKEKSNLGDPSAGGVDTITLREATSTLTTITTTLFSFISVIIIIIVPIIVSIELLYIIFPFFRSGTEDMIEWMKKHDVKVAKASKKTIELSLRDARQAVIEAETIKTGKSALAIYFIHKCKSIMFLMFIIALVMLGLGTIIDVVANLFDGIITLIMDMIYTTKNR